MPNNFYSQNEADEILRRAVHVQADGLTKEQLYQAAAEMGVSSADIDKAASDLEFEKAQKDHLKFVKQTRRKLLGKSVTEFLTASLFFVLIWFLCGRGYFWPMWILPWIFIGFVHEIFGVDKSKRMRRELKRAGRDSFLADRLGRPLPVVEDQTAVRVNINIKR